MAENPQKLKVVYSVEADNDLGAIWDWNAAAHNLPHADAYRAFLKSRADELGTHRLLARPVTSRPQYSHIVIRRSRSRHGHVAVFEINKDTLIILRFFHTAQDWESKL